MTKKIFISYSWGNKEHQNWVVNFGTRLMSDSVDVVLDRWSLKDGHDIHSFMEEMVKAEDIFRVLVICDKSYKEKADNREGGVGTETQIITPEIYGDVKQEKFIPVVLERDEQDKPYLPIYLASRKYIDFSSDEFFENSYEELLRNIFETPALPKPKLATTPPLYITETTINNSELNSKIRALKSQIDKYPDRINRYASDFIDSFLEKLWDFQLNCSSNNLIEFGDSLYGNLVSYKILRDDFIEFLQIVTQLDTKLDVDELISFFEKQPLYLSPPEGSGRSSWRSGDFDNYKIMFQELFIYTIAACLKNKNYPLASEFLYSKYHKQDRYNNSKEINRFTFLYSYHENLENYIKNKYQKVSGFGYYVISNLNENFSKDIFILADTLCYVVSELYKTNNYLDTWFPASYVYSERRKLDLFEKLDSKRFFEKVKMMFNTSSPEELIGLINLYKENNKDQQPISYGWNRLPFANEFIQIDKIAINR